MRRIAIVAFVAVAALLCCAPAGTTAARVIDVDFDSTPTGKYTEADANSDFSNNVDWDKGLDEGRANIVSNSAGTDKWLRITYPKGKIGSQNSGAQIKVKFDKSGNRYSELYVSYRIRMGGYNGAFDFVKGGKLPGLCGGSCPTGGNKPSGSSGFSARMMWRRLGAAVQYMYYYQQPSKYGEDWDWSLGGDDVTFPVNTWVTVETRVKLNSVGSSNGVVESWWNGQKALSRSGVSLRTSSSFGINIFYISTFFGGGDSSWAPPADCVIDYDNIVVSTTCTTCGGAAPSGPSPPSPPAPTPPRTTPRPPTPAPPSSNGGSCSGVRVIVEKVKDYYTRLTLTPASAIASVFLSKSTSSGGWMQMTSSYGDHEASTSKMTANRVLKVNLKSGGFAQFLVRRSPRPQEDDLLPCTSSGTSSSIDEGPVAPLPGPNGSQPTPASDPDMPVLVASVDGRTAIAGQMFAPLLEAKPTELAAAVEQDLYATLGLDNRTYDVRITNMSIGSLIVDFSVTKRAAGGNNSTNNTSGSNSTSNGTMIDEKALQMALDEAAAEDTGAHADGEAEGSMAFAAVAALYDEQPNVTDSIYLKKAVVGPNETELAAAWQTHHVGLDDAPDTPDNNGGGNAPPPEGDGSSSGGGGCGAGCYAGVAVAVVVAVGVAVAVAMMVSRRGAGRAAAGASGTVDTQSGAGAAASEYKTLDGALQDSELRAAAERQASV